MTDELENQDSQIPGGTDGAPEDDANDVIDPEAAPEGETLEEQNARLAEANRRLYARLQKTKVRNEVKVEVSNPEPKKPAAKSESDSNEDVIRARLEARGFLDEAEQDLILKFSRGLGVTPMDASKDELVTAQIEKMRQNQKTQNAIPTPSGKAGSKNTHTPEYYIEKGELPDDPAMFEKVQAELKRRSIEGMRITNPNDN